jgi:hypothetical protein
MTANRHLNRGDQRASTVATKTLKDVFSTSDTMRVATLRRLTSRGHHRHRHRLLRHQFKEDSTTGAKQRIRPRLSWAIWVIQSKNDERSSRRSFNRHTMAATAKGRSTTRHSPCNTLRSKLGRVQSTNPRRRRHHHRQLLLNRWCDRQV